MHPGWGGAGSGEPAWKSDDKLKTGSDMSRLPSSFESAESPHVGVGEPAMNRVASV